METAVVVIETLLDAIKRVIVTMETLVLHSRISFIVSHCSTHRFINLITITVLRRKKFLVITLNSTLNLNLALIIKIFINQNLGIMFSVRLLPGYGTTSELPLIGITNFWNYHSLMLVIAMLVILRFLIGISTS